MQRFIQRKTEFSNAYERLKEALNEEESEIVIDGALHRFEFTFELAWKELAQKIGNNEKIELEKDIAISNELNQSDFSKRMLSDEDYTISVNKNEFSGYDIYPAGYGSLPENAGSLLCQCGGRNGFR